MERLAFVGGSGHETLAELRDEQNKDYVIWGFVRNPYDKLVSLFHWWTQNNGDWNEDLQAKPYLGEANFEFFIKDYLEDHVAKDVREYLHNKKFFDVGIQQQWIFFENVFIWDSSPRIGKFESLVEDFQAIQKDIREDLNFSLGHAHKSKRKHYKDYFTKETYAIVNRVYEKDFELFGYEREIE